ncbi:MAG: DUF1330 domain-containing protein [Rhodospirillales bacterium]|nr:DUF1330 domain-containing protein [Rhodospirillales bacterium]
MPAYLIVDVDLRDSTAYEAYKSRVPALIARHGGEYLVRGGEHEVLEGEWRPHRLVLFRFPDRAAIGAFMADPDYAPLKALRQRIASTDAVAVDGIG